MGDFNIGLFILYMVALIFSLSVHEFGHAWVSLKFGDDLAYVEGRVTLNPIAHVDPIGTLLFPAIAFFTGAPLIGWAKPVPVNPLRWRNQRVANFWVSIAGILGNLLIALCAGIGLRILLAVSAGRGFEDGPTTMQAVVTLLSQLFLMNIGLAIFNLLPIPPLDGSKIIASILPGGFNQNLMSIENIGAQYGFIILYLLMFSGLLGAVFGLIYPLAKALLLLGT